MLMSKKNQRGDTLIEVMVAMAIVASVLGAAYTTSARALRLARQAQERAEAVKFTQSQIESLKYLSKTKPTEVFVDKKI